MKKTQINPWSWQDEFDFSQAWRVDAPNSIVYVSGQVSFDDEGEVVGEGDFDAQCRQVFKNIQMILETAGTGPLRRRPVDDDAPPRRAKGGARLLRAWLTQRP